MYIYLSRSQQGRVLRGNLEHDFSLIIQKKKEKNIASERPADKHQTRERLLPYTSARPLPFLSPRQMKKYGAVFERHSHASSASEGTELTHELEAPVLREPHVHLKRQGSQESDAVSAKKMIRAWVHTVCTDEVLACMWSRQKRDQQ